MPRPHGFVFVLAVASAAAQPCTDQQYVPGFTNGLEVTNRQDVVQTFKVGFSGHLVAVELLGINHHRQPAVDPIQFAIVATQGGVPINQVLASATLQPNQIPLQRGNTPVLVDIAAANLQVQADDVYGIWLQTNAPSGGNTYAWWGDAPGGYADGATFIRLNTGPLSFDLGFRTLMFHNAARSNYGNGHPGSNGVPSLDLSANPVLGTTVNLLVGNSLGSATSGVLLLGSAAASVGTPFGGTVLVAFSAAVPLPVPAAGASLPWGIPAAPSLCGAEVFAQAVMADGGASAGVSFTRGLRADLGR